MNIYESNELDQVIWMAGYFDADGHVTLAKNQSLKRIPRASVSSKNPRSLEIFQANYGGGIHHSDGHVPQWTLTGKKAVVFLKDIVHYLVVKRKRAELVIEYSRLGALRQHVSTMAEDTISRMMEIEELVDVYNAARTEAMV